MGMPRGGQGGRGDKGPNSYGQHSGPYGQGGGLGMAGGAGGGWTPAGATGGRGSIEMPNIQALGLSSGMYISLNKFYFQMDFQISISLISISPR